jgi:hypothetical protein
MKRPWRWTAFAGGRTTRGKLTPEQMATGVHAVVTASVCAGTQAATVLRLRSADTARLPDKRVVGLQVSQLTVGRPGRHC